MRDKAEKVFIHWMRRQLPLRGSDRWKRQKGTRDRGVGTSCFTAVISSFDAVMGRFANWLIRGIGIGYWAVADQEIRPGCMICWRRIRWTSNASSPSPVVRSSISPNRRCTFAKGFGSMKRSQLLKYQARSDEA